MTPTPKSWLDPYAVFLALALTLAAALPRIATTSVQRDFYFFDVMLTSDTAGSTQFFWDLGRGLNDADSSVQPLKVERKPVRYRFMMPPGTYRAFRFEPVDHPAQLTLAAARIVDIRGHVIHVFKPEDFKAGVFGSELVQQGNTLLFRTTTGHPVPALDLAVGGPVELPARFWMMLRPALPLSLSVLFFGLLLGSPRLMGRLSGCRQPPAQWLAARPRLAILLVATLAVAVQAHPVIFGGRSFVSPNNGSLMLYSDQPTLPGATQVEFADSMGSDIGGMLFNHIYYPMVERQALLHDGELPLWNRYNLAGVPLLGQGQSMLGDPFNLLTILADGAGWAWDVRFLIARWLFATGLGLAVWMLTRHLPSAVLVTLGAGFISFFTYRINHPANFSVGYAPWILVTWVGLVQSADLRRQAWWLGGLLAAHWVEFSSGTMKEASMLICFLDQAGVLLVLLVPAAAGRRIRLLLLAIATGAVFALLSAPLWMSFFSALRHSVTGYDQPRADTIVPARLIGLFDDIFYRQQWTEEWVLLPGLNFLFLA
ncbi:MAG: hypothetical protein ABUL68_04330, partial [Pseudomonadota bacterium]